MPYFPFRGQGYKMQSIWVGLLFYMTRKLKGRLAAGLATVTSVTVSHNRGSVVQCRYYFWRWFLEQCCIDMLLCFMKRYSNIYSLSSDHLRVLDSSFMCAWSTCMEPSYWWHWLRNIGELFLGLQPIVGFVCSPFLLKSLSKNLENDVRKVRITKGMERLSSQKQGRFGYFSQMKTEKGDDRGL